jgi:hypothetical protein
MTADARFIYNLACASYHKEWDRNYQKAGPSAFVLAIFIRILLKIVTPKGPVLQGSYKPSWAGVRRQL